MTIRACIMGWPVEHSRSPLIHGYWIRQHALDAAYVKQPLDPAEAHAFFRALRQHGFTGGNVTIPHKQVAFAAADRVDAAASIIGAVNTLWHEGERLIGGNTDADGYLANLDADCPGWDSACDSALILGAGGAALAICHALLSRGVTRVLVANRTAARVEELIERFGPRVVAVAWDQLPERLREIDLLVNTTSLGMIGKEALSLSLDTLKPAAIVSDIVYVPLETALLIEARNRGHRTSGGLGMLLHQAVPGFERWFGLRPAVTPELAQLAAADIPVRA